jgi:hypothetical protein
VGAISLRVTAVFVRAGGVQIDERGVRIAQRVALSIGGSPVPQ